MSTSFRFSKALYLAAAAVLCWLCVCTLGQASAPLSYLPPQEQAKSQVVLYYRYQNSPYLGMEIRDITIPYTDSIEKSMVQALIDGPGHPGSFLQPLFPPDTQVLSVLAEGNRLFVTFNQAFLSPMMGESGIPAESSTAAAKQRRALALSALVNTLTQTGIYREVQVLIQGQQSPTTSMRLSRRYFLEDSDMIPDPLLRDEKTIITPGRAADLLLQEWKNKNQTGFTKGIKLDNQTSPENTDIPNLRSLPALLSWETSQGLVTPTGQSSTITLNATFRYQDGQERHLLAYPLLLQYEDNIWKICLSSLQALLEAAE